MAGKIRYLDSRIDEQERGITMEASAVSLSYGTLTKDGKRQDYIINLIDTPGHVDFSGEVSASTRICDGALVMVDALEGVCTQTIAVLKQAWVEKLKPILVINKIDRLILELRLAPIEAHHHLIRLVEQVNAVIGTFYASEKLEEQEKYEERQAKKNATAADANEAIANSATDHVADTQQAEDDEDIYFAPEMGNVIFCSAIHGWAFRIDQFASLHASRLGIASDKLKRVLWGDFYYDPKTKRVVSRKRLPPGKTTLKPLFVQLILENLWAVYNCVVLQYDLEKINKVATALKIKLKPQDLKSKEPSNLLFAILTQWLPLASCVFRAVVDIIPPPLIAQRLRLPAVLGLSDEDLSSSQQTIPLTKAQESLMKADSPEQASCAIAYISKMFAVPTADLPQNQRRQLTAEEMRQKGREAREAQAQTVSTSLVESNASNSDAVPEKPDQIEGDSMIAFARVYSGTIQANQIMYCVFPKYDPTRSPNDLINTKQVIVVKLAELYLLMGRELVQVPKVSAGQVFGIGGLDEVVMRSATLCSVFPLVSDVQASPTDNSPAESGTLVNLGRLVISNPPILRMAIEAKKPSDQPKLIAGLKKLSQADPAVATMIQETGETVICAAGELHAERCIRDLEERFAKVKVQKGNILVPFKETIVKHSLPPESTESLPIPQASHVQAADGAIRFDLRALPLPLELTRYLTEHAEALRKVTQSQSVDLDFLAPNTLKTEANQESEADTLNQLRSLIKRTGGLPSVEYLRTLGPRNIGPNLLFSTLRGPQNLLQRALQESKIADVHGTNIVTRIVFESLDTAFQLFTLRGPLCAEPLEGVAFCVDNLCIEGDSIEETKMAQLSGQLISALQDAFKAAFLEWSPRLLLAMYSCDIQAAPDVLGKVYGVVSKRRGRIISEEMKESTSFFTIRALLPVIDSFGFAEEIRKRTSGAASPQLTFHGFEMLNQDPFWVPTTEEELEDLGDTADKENVAKRYMDQVRKRKGLATGRKVVEEAEKQRTLKR